jgi:DNA invertase Pin-like site-specific DNA recombinase
LKIVVVIKQLELNGVISRTIAALLLGLAEIEHGNIRERQKTGIEAAKARGSIKANPGRSKKLKKKGLSMDEIATALGVSTRTVACYLDCLITFLVSRSDRTSCSTGKGLFRD